MDLPRGGSYALAREMPSATAERPRVLVEDAGPFLSDAAAPPDRRPCRRATGRRRPASEIRASIDPPHSGQGDDSMRNTVVATLCVAVAIMTGTGADAATVPIPPAMPASGLQIAANTQMVVAHSYANLREQPTTHSKLLAKLNKGTKLDVIEKVSGGKWTHVKVNGMEGYISTNLLK